MPTAGFEPTIPGSERPQTHALDRAATGIGGFEPRTVQFVASHYTDYALPAPAACYDTEISLLFAVCVLLRVTLSNWPPFTEP